VFSVIATDLVNVFVNPGLPSLIAFFVDIAHFVGMPILAGFVGASVFVNYEIDTLTYNHAKLTQDDLNESTMIFVKDAIYTAIGRP